jgi:hypothetical protein
VNLSIVESTDASRETRSRTAKRGRDTDISGACAGIGIALHWGRR